MLEAVPSLPPIADDTNRVPVKSEAKCVILKRECGHQGVILLVCKVITTYRYDMVVVHLSPCFVKINQPDSGGKLFGYK